MQVVLGPGTEHRGGRPRRPSSAKAPMKDSTAHDPAAAGGQGVLWRALRSRAGPTSTASGCRRRGRPTRAVRQVIDRLCGGSVERLLLGMVNGWMLISPEQLEELTRKLAQAEQDEREDEEPGQ